MDGAKEISFKVFQTQFREAITSLTFGEPLGSNGRRESAASKELRRTKLLDVLKGNEFCKTIYGLSQECRRFEAERKKVPQVARRMRPVIHQYLSATRRLENCARKLSEFDEKYLNLIDHQMGEKISSAIALIKAVSDELDRRRKILVSNVHPKHRRSKDEQSEWELLFKEYNYDLETLGVKATDQWLWQNVNDALLGWVQRHEVQSISAMTRFKLIAAISEAAGHGTVPATTIKQYFLEHPPQRA